MGAVAECEIGSLVYWVGYFKIVRLAFISKEKGVRHLRMLFEEHTLLQNYL
jgi:hypothetical protein